MYFFYYIKFKGFIFICYLYLREITDPDLVVFLLFIKDEEKENNRASKPHSTPATLQW